MEKRKLSQEEIFEKIDSTFNFFNEQRVKGLEEAYSQQAIKNLLLKEERERLRKKYGDDHPRIKKISNQLTFNSGFLKEIDSEIERAKIEVPDVDPDSWMVHGRIIDEDSKGISDITVSIYNDEGKWVRKMGSSCTNLLGYFSIIYKPKDGEQDHLEKQKLFLTIIKENKIIHKEEDPLFIIAGQIDYREIIFSEIKNENCPTEEKPSDIPSDMWIVRGIVTDEENNGIKGLIVSVYDKDMIFDDVLGTTLTDEDGKFEILYRTDAFKGIFEKKPDLFLKVLDEEGRKIYSTRNAIHYQAGHEEYFKIKIRNKK